MVTKPSSSSGQGSRIGTMYVGKKIGGGVNSNVNNKGNVSSNSGVVNNINSSNIKGSNTNIGLK
jgi:hypothetical protein